MTTDTAEDGDALVSNISAESGGVRNASNQEWLVDTNCWNDMLDNTTRISAFRRTLCNEFS